MEFSEFPEKSWSSSKIKMIEDCPRSYYFNYYGSHNGWLESAGEEQKEAYRLKKLTNIYMIKGIALHEQFKMVFNEISKEKAILYKTEKDVINAVVNKLKEAVKDSITNLKSGKYDVYPCKGIMLQEYYYGGKISKEIADNIKAQVEICVENFFTTKAFDRISSLKDFVIIENDDIGFNNCLYFNDVKLYFKIDLLYKEEDGTYIVVDWKTGKYDEGDKEQLLMYVYYVAQKYNVDLNKIKGRIEYLLSGETFEIDFDKFEINYMHKKIEEDIVKMEIYLSDIKANKPKEIGYFPKTDDNLKCTSCKFRRICNST